MKNTNVSKNTTVNAVRTTDGFIEITSLALLDEMVGGLIDPQALFCQVNDDDQHHTAKRFSAEGL